MNRVRSIVLLLSLTILYQGQEFLDCQIVPSLKLFSGYTSFLLSVGPRGKSLPCKFFDNEYGDPRSRNEFRMVQFIDSRSLLNSDHFRIVI